jgi:hypothetical protein
MSERRELYRSPNGDSWFLGREPTTGHAFIIHQPNAPSGATGVAALDRNVGGCASICGEAPKVRTPRPSIRRGVRRTRA